MKWAVLGRVGAVAILLPSLTNCDGEYNSPVEQQNISYASRDPGSAATPTQEISFQLLAADGQVRLAHFQKLMVESGKRCDVVTSGVLKVGLDDTDEWRVKCANSGDWAVWFRSNGTTEIMHCSRDNCS
jgi:hypothetical protein